MISLKRIGLVAKRDFLVTVSNKGFLFGVLEMPLIMVIIISLVPKLMKNAGAQINVEVALPIAARASPARCARNWM